MELRFYGYRDELSNMYPVRLKIDGKTFNCVEHYFQYCKFKDTDPSYQNRILEQTSGYEQKKLGSSRQHKIDPNWDKNRMKVMARQLYYKFHENQFLREYLLHTKDQILIENNPHDDYWGIGDGNGKNVLGKMLMEIREELKGEYESL